MVNTVVLRNDLRPMVRGWGDLQKQRIQFGNRIAANFHAKLGRAPGASEEALDEESASILKDLRSRYRRITDGMAKFPNYENFVGDEVISRFTELCLIRSYEQLLKLEEEQLKMISSVLNQFPIYTSYLSRICGVGPTMSAVIISELDPRDDYIGPDGRICAADAPGAVKRRRYVSSFFRYAGLDVAEDGRGRSRRAEHLIDVTYIAKDGTTKTKKSLVGNPWLKSKLVGVLSGVLMIHNRYYKAIYNGYKHRLETDPARQNDEWNTGRRHRAAIRYMVKIFLKELYLEWRRIEGLEIYPSYAEAKLGIAHNNNVAAVQMVGKFRSAGDNSD